MKVKITLLATMLFISGCSSTGVIPMGQDSYFIGRKDKTPGIGISLSNKAKVYNEANEFCAGKGLEVSVIKESVISSVPLRFGSTELNFKCVSPNNKDVATSQEGVL